MVKQKIRTFFIFMMLIVVTQSGVVTPRHEPPYEDGESDEGKESGRNIGIRDETDDYRSGAEPERSLPYRDEHSELDDDEKNEIDDSADYGTHGPFDAEEDSEESVGGGLDPEVPVPEEVDESDDDVRPTEDGDDETGNVPGFGLEGGFGGDGKGPGFFFDFSLLDLGRIREYFHQLERALEVAFRQTVDEARLLNDTYVNTTEEEIDINGNKYIVQKSIIKGGDNHSSFYVETLTSKEKEEGNQETNGMEIRNETTNTGS